MAADQSGRPTFPVWVGSLDENVNEKQLFRKFSKFGMVSSVKIQRDSATGKSKGFGWVNFNLREAAELSAAKMAGVALYGSPIKTRGPAELEKKGLFSQPAPRNDFRPFTDCSFFVQGKRCKKGATVRRSLYIATFLELPYTPFAFPITSPPKL
jgi:RNA recognition motif-containing protein